MSRLLKATEVASLFQVDLKTIHVWVDRGKISAARTPGNHLRFSAATVLADMRRFFLPEMIPDALIKMAAADDMDTKTAAIATKTFLEKHGLPVPTELLSLIKSLTPTEMPA